jgi:hypothetical protein
LRGELAALAPDLEFEGVVREGDAEWDIPVTGEQGNLRIAVTFLEPDFPHKGEWAISILPEFSLRQSTAEAIAPIERAVTEAVNGRAEWDVTLATPSKFVSFRKHCLCS